MGAVRPSLRGWEGSGGGTAVPAVVFWGGGDRR